MVFSTFILRYVESKFTLLTYLMVNNKVITVISYCTKGLNSSTKQNKSLSLSYTTKHSLVNTVTRFSTTDIINSYFTRKQYECKNVRMKRGFRVKRCSIKRIKNHAIIDNRWKICGITDALAITGFLQMTHSHQSDEQNCCSLDIFVLYALFSLRNRQPHYV